MIFNRIILFSGTSLMVRLLNSEPYRKNVASNTFNNRYVVQLTQNYRSHPTLLRLPNMLFYDNQLIAEAPAGRTFSSNKNKPKLQKLNNYFNFRQNKLVYWRWSQYLAHTEFPVNFCTCRQCLLA